MNALLPEVGIIEIFPRGDVEQAGDALTDEGRLEVAGRLAAIDHRGRCVEQARQMRVRGFLHFGDAPKLPLLLLARGIVQRELDDLRDALNAGVAGLASKTRNTAAAAISACFRPFPITQPSQTARFVCRRRILDCP